MYVYVLYNLCQDVRLSNNDPFYSYRINCIRNDQSRFNYERGS